MNAQETTNMQITARNFLHVGLHHGAPRCTTVQKVHGAHLNQCTAPHLLPLGEGAVVHLVQRQGAEHKKPNLQFFAGTTGREPTTTNAQFFAERTAMRTSPETALNELLVRWHRWSSAPARVADTRMADFDAVLAMLPTDLRSAVQVQARSLAVGAAVWSSVRAGEIGKARAWLRALLADDEERWFGADQVKLNERGNRIGESNPKAGVTDHEVDLLLQLREQGYTYAWLAEKFGIAKSTVGSWCTGRTRGQAPAKVKRVR